MPRTHLTEAEREQRRNQDRERIRQAVGLLLDSDGWRRWVKVRARNGLARYSLHNQLLIALQRPDATYIAGFRAFLDLDRCVRKGERSIRILAPVIGAGRKDANMDEQPRPAEQPRRTRFRAIAVFDVSQTEPLPGTDPLPLEPPAAPVTGETHRRLLAPLEDLAGELGYSVSHQRIDGPADGWCDSERRRITVNSRLPVNGRVRVLIHEVAHALGVSYKDYGRGDAEVIVDTATYIVCSSQGLDVSGSSVPYVTGWGEEQTGERIERFAGVIDTLARRIEAAVEAREP
jgi:N-terminal domain of anti-restriction factor ArdC